MAIVACRECGQTVSTEATACPHCGCEQPSRAPLTGTAAAPPDILARTARLTASPGHSPAAYAPLFPSGNDAALLRHVRGWNWGAFFLNWIWAFSHGLTWWGVGLLVLAILSVFVPFLPLVFLGVTIYIAIRGSEMAWERRHFRDLADFRAVQTAWRNWGIVVFIFEVLLGVFLFLCIAAVMAKVL